MIPEEELKSDGLAWRRWYSQMETLEQSKSEQSAEKREARKEAKKRELSEGGAMDSPSPTKKRRP